MSPASSTIRLSAGLSTHPSPAAAAEHACAEALGGLRARVDLALVFFSSHHAPHAETLRAAAAKALSPACLVGVSAESILGGGLELENVPGVSVLAFSIPGVRVTPFTGEPLLQDATSPARPEVLASALGAGPDFRGSLLFADPFSVPMTTLLPALSRVAAGTPILGGLASASRSPGGNVLLLNDRVLRGGGVGVSLAGEVEIDCVVSQGCRPFGPAAIITKAKGNVIFELGGRPTQEVVKQALDELGDSARSLLREGLLLGLVLNEYKDRFGRGDFLIRNVVGLDQSSGGIAIAGLPRVGQTVRFHHRDRATADEDLALLLDAQKLHAPPAGCLLVTCQGRGTKLFSKPHHDAGALARAFAAPRSGEDLSKGGEAITPGSRAGVPIAGFFASGEIGPIGGDSHLHAHTACAAIFRARSGG